MSSLLTKTTYICLALMLIFAIVAGIGFIIPNSIISPLLETIGTIAAIVSAIIALAAFEQNKRTGQPPPVVPSGRIPDESPIPYKGRQLMAKKIYEAEKGSRDAEAYLEQIKRFHEAQREKCVVIELPGVRVLYCWSSNED